MAPADTLLLFRVVNWQSLSVATGQIQITDATIERALDRGWRRDDVLQFSRDNGKSDLPATLNRP